MNNRIATMSAVCGILLIANQSAANAAESPADVCRSAAKYFEAGDLDGALEEAQWCVDLLKQQKSGQLAEMFPDEVNGFIGREVENDSSVLGVDNTSRTYEKDGQTITVSVTSGSIAASALGGLAALAGLASMGSNQKMRIQRQTVMEIEGGEYMVNLKGAGMMQVRAEGVSRDVVVEFLEAFPLKEFADALEN